MTFFKSFRFWSWSMLQIYRKCPYWARLRYIDKSPLPPIDDKDEKRLRGIDAHDSMSKFVLADGTLPELHEALKPFKDILFDVRDIRTKGLGIVTSEVPKYYDQNWRPQETRQDYWFQMIPDIHVKVPSELNMTVDGKTGKKYGNEVSHFGQMEFYAVCAWIDDPTFDLYKSELWYFDKKDVWSIDFTPRQLELARKKLDDEVARMFADKVHRPRPSKIVCRYCPYSPKGTGACAVGVS